MPVSISPKKIPLVPEGRVVYPKQKFLIDIKDGKFKQLIHQCEENDLQVGLVPVVRKRLFAYGTVIRLCKVVSRQENGNCTAEFEGLRIFRLRKFLDRYSADVIYPGGEISYPKEQDKLPSLFLQKLAERTFKQIEKLMSEKTGSLVLPIDSKRDKRNDELTSFYMLQRLVGLSLEEQAIYLAIRSEERRFALLYDQLKRLLDVLKGVFK